MREQDHPHACGDKDVVARYVYFVTGSSPCVWGQVQVKSFKSPLPRIIPMRVGTSQEQSCHFTVKQDHPHACGDK